MKHENNIRKNYINKECIIFKFDYIEKEDEVENDFQGLLIIRSEINNVLEQLKKRKEAGLVLIRIKLLKSVCEEVYSP